jgi:hypothetical protein
VEIEVPEGMDLPTAIQAATPEKEQSSDNSVPESNSEAAAEASPVGSIEASESTAGAAEASEKPPEVAESTAAEGDK